MQTFLASSKPRKRELRPVLLGLAFISSFLTLIFIFYLFESHGVAKNWTLLQHLRTFTHIKPIPKSHIHPVSSLIANSFAAFQTTLSTDTAPSLSSAAQNYRKRRGRHPPPDFDKWYAYASARNAVIVEQFWGQIYEDVEPLRSLNPPELRRRARSGKLEGPVVRIRNGVLGIVAENTNEWDDGEDNGGKVWVWKDIFARLAREVKESGAKLPDIDIPLNLKSEGRVIVPFEEVEALGLGRVLMPDVGDVKAGFSISATLSDSEFNHSTETKRSARDFDPQYRTSHLPPLKEGYLGPRPYRPYWTLVRLGCPPDSEARKEGRETLIDIWQPQGHTDPEHSAVSLLRLSGGKKKEGYGTYIQDWEEATNICNMPHLQGLHGAFVQPSEVRSSQLLFPVWTGGGKLAVNNDIVIPGAGEWNISSCIPGEMFDGKKHVPWKKKKDVLYWRGPASGGTNKRNNWQRFHRHRVVAMVNASHVAFAERSLKSGNESEKGVGPAGNFVLLDSMLGMKEIYGEKGRLEEWVRSWADVEATDLRCYELKEGDACPYNSQCFSVDEVDTLMEIEQDRKRNKYTVVLDGDGGDDEGELLRALRSGSVVLRASVYRNWMDRRIWPWVHYVPVDNTFRDVYVMMEYFLGGLSSIGSRSAVLNDGREADMKVNNKEDVENGHDAEARYIAENAKSWAEKGLRTEDMLIYLYRLILEYARIFDDSRERLGWVEDLLERENGR